MNVCGGGWLYYKFRECLCVGGYLIISNLWFLRGGGIL